MSKIVVKRTLNSHSRGAPFYAQFGSLHVTFAKSVVTLGISLFSHDQNKFVLSLIKLKVKLKINILMLFVQF